MPCRPIWLWKPRRTEGRIKDMLCLPGYLPPTWTSQQMPETPTIKEARRRKDQSPSSWRGSSNLPHPSQAWGRTNESTALKWAEPIHSRTSMLTRVSWSSSLTSWEQPRLSLQATTNMSNSRLPSRLSWTTYRTPWLQRTKSSKCSSSSRLIRIILIRWCSLWKEWRVSYSKCIDWNSAAIRGTFTSTLLKEWWSPTTVWTSSLTSPTTSSNLLTSKSWRTPLLRMLGSSRMECITWESPLLRRRSTSTLRTLRSSTSGTKKSSRARSSMSGSVLSYLSDTITLKATIRTSLPRQMSWWTFCFQWLYQR